MHYRKILTLVLAAALSACGSSDETGDTGGGGSKGGPSVTCGDAPMITLTMDDVTAPVEITGQTGESDEFFGTCTPEGSEGNEAVVHFKAPEAGFYRFSTEGSGFDTVIYALADCDDGFSELGCRDPGEGKEAYMTLNLQQDQEIFLVVDARSARSPQDFKVEAKKIVADPPKIDKVDGYMNPSRNAMGLVATGTNPDSPIVGYLFQMYNQAGQALFQQPIEHQFGAWNAYFDIEQEAGTFRIDGSVGFNYDGTLTISKLEIKLIDDNGLVSALATATTGTTKDFRDVGDECDPWAVLNRCADGIYCLALDGAEQATCHEVSASTLTAADAFVNAEAGLIGVEVRGTDAEGDMLYAVIEPKDGDEALMELTNPNAIFHTLQKDAETKEFRGVATMAPTFVSCIDSAQAAYDACVEGCSDQACADKCYEDAVAMIEPCNLEEIAKIVSVDVKVRDRGQQVSEPLNALVNPTPQAEIGEPCDAAGSIGICGEDAWCYADSDDTFAVATCQEDGLQCDANVIDLRQHASGDSWTFKNPGDGSTTNTGMGAASCSGGLPTDAHHHSDVYYFESPGAGSYEFKTTNLGLGVDTVISSRYFCQLPEYEVSCNDNNGTSAPASATTLNFGGRGGVFILVQSRDGKPLGPYTLTVTKR